MSRHTSFFLLANTGMRRGELLGLRWCDLGLESRRLSVCQALASVAYDVEISDVKTGTGRRTIDIDDGTVQAVRDWFNSRTEERDGVVPAPRRPRVRQARRLVGCPDVFSQVFDRKVAQVKVPTISLHDLRHTHATLLLKAGVPVKVVSERLGHANVAFTMSVYQHVLPGMQAEAAATFPQLLVAGRRQSDLRRG